MERKNADYASGADPFGNLSLCETIGLCSREAGIVIRMADKIRRLATLTHTAAACKDESFDDTCLDIINYTILLLASRRARPSPPDFLYVRKYVSRSEVESTSPPSRKIVEGCRYCCAPLERVFEGGHWCCKVCKARCLRPGTMLSNKAEEVARNENSTLYDPTPADRAGLNSIPITMRSLQGEEVVSEPIMDTTPPPVAVGDRFLLGTDSYVVTDIGPHIALCSRERDRHLVPVSLLQIANCHRLPRITPHDHQ